MGGAIPPDPLKTEQNHLTREPATIQRRLDSYHADAHLARQHLTQALDLLEDCHHLYAAAPKHLKNTVFFQQVLVNPDTNEHGNLVLPGNNQPPQDMEDEKESTEDACPGQEPVGQAADHTDADPASQHSAHHPSAGPSGRDKTDEVEWTGDIEDTFASALAPAPIRVYDHDSHTSTVAFLTHPSTSSPTPASTRPHATANQDHTPAQSTTSNNGGDGDEGQDNGYAVGTHRPHPDDHTDATASQRKTPTPKGERTSSAETAPPRAETA